MALKRPPQHRSDADPVFVHSDDDAWDHERIKVECAKMREEGLSPSRHPVNVYHSGESRYDLGAAYDVLGTLHSAAEYLGPTAVRFTLRRLSTPELYRVTDMGPTTALGRLYACRIGLASVEGPGPKVKREEWGLTEESLDALREWGVWLPMAVGAAVYVASQPLTDSEKKP